MDNRFRLAPMMGYSTPPMRKLIRLISPNTLNYTEMVPINAILHNPKDHYMAFAEGEGPTAFQIGGNDIAGAVKVACKKELKVFSEININVGCPSPRVKNGQFGACLMAQPKLVGDMVKALKDQLQGRVTVKHRIGLDGDDDFMKLTDFVGVLVDAGCDGVIVHNRMALLNGISPRKNRSVPPLKPLRSHQLKASFPQLNICANGEINSLSKANKYFISQNELPAVDGIMVGRAACSNPWLFFELENERLPSEDERDKVLQEYLFWVKNAMFKPYSLSSLVRPLIGFYSGEDGAKVWRKSVALIANKQKPFEWLLDFRHSDLASVH